MQGLQNMCNESLLFYNLDLGNFIPLLGGNKCLSEYHDVEFLMAPFCST